MTETVTLVRKGKTIGEWLSVKDMLADIISEKVVLGAGDHLVVGLTGPVHSAMAESVREHLRVVGNDT